MLVILYVVLLFVLLICFIFISVLDLQLILCQLVAKTKFHILFNSKFKYFSFI